MTKKEPARMTRTYPYEDVLREYRGLNTAPICNDCGGWGVKLYGTTATWHGGAGGLTMTDDVCDKCWGSGNADKPWPSHRTLMGFGGGGVIKE